MNFSKRVFRFSCREREDVPELPLFPHNWYLRCWTVVINDEDDDDDEDDFVQHEIERDRKTKTYASAFESEFNEILNEL